MIGGKRWQEMLPPLDNVKTAYDLLNWICQTIIEEPARYDQQNTLLLAFSGRDGHKAHHHYTITRPLPQCGTVGCVAGWTVAATQVRFPRKDTWRKGYQPSYNGGVLRTAQRVLGLTYQQADRLFSECAVPGGGTYGGGEVVLRQHAHAGVAHIRRFMRIHKRQLQAKRLRFQRR